MSLLMLRGHHVSEADVGFASLFILLHYSPIAQVAHKVKGSTLFNCLSKVETVRVALDVPAELAGIGARALGCLSVIASVFGSVGSPLVCLLAEHLLSD